MIGLSYAVSIESGGQGCNCREKFDTLSHTNLKNDGMKADEVLKRYEAGRRDFSDENLRGQCFKGKDLSGANFSDADIRGANFTNATLTGVNFSGAKAGLQRRWAIGLGTILLLLAAVSSLFSTYASQWVGSVIATDFGLKAIIFGAIVLITSIIFFLVTIRQGFVAALGAVALTWAVILAGSASMSICRAVLPCKFLSLDLAAAAVLTLASTVAGVLAVSLCISMAGAMSMAMAGAVAVTVAGFVAWAAGWAVIEGFSLAGTFDRLYPPTANWTSLPVAMAGTWAAVGVGLSTYVSWQALAGDEKYALVRSFAIAFAAIGGTSFRNADLTDADFTSATLKSTDFRRATLTRTRWHQTKKLDHIRPGTTYLQFPQVRQLLLTGQGQAQNFDRQSLRGVNLQGANLADASFIGADLSEANLQEANLSRAKLVQTQLDDADLTGATLTGATIEDWGITSHTKLHGVRCEYVFMRVPTKEDPNPRRKPDNWNENFSEGDFADFIKPIVDTLDLYHNQDVDPRAIAISFKQLAENHPEAELEIVAMEKRGESKFLLRAATAPNANHSKLNTEYFDTYNQVKALPKQEFKALLEEKDRRIISLETMVKTALQRHSFYAENYHNQGDTMPERKNEIGNINFGDGAAFGSVTGDNTGTVTGNQTINYSEQKQTLAEAAAEIQKLLQQLEQANPSATEAEKKAYVTASVPPTLRARTVSALKAGGKEALKELLDNSYVNIGVAIVEGWQSPG